MSRFLLVLALLLPGAASAQEVKSHPPLREAPKPTPGEVGKGPAYFVHPTKGDDTKEGTRAAPWKTIKHGLTRLKPGDTLYLHGGVYYETSYVALAGRPDAPITITSVPGELAVIDGGLK